MPDTWATATSNFTIDSNGTLRFTLSEAPPPRSPATTRLYDLNLDEEWAKFNAEHPTYSGTGARRRGFKNYLRKLTYQGYRVESHVKFCCDCGDPKWHSNCYVRGNNRWICSNCVHRYAYCSHCQVYYPAGKYDAHERTHVCCTSPAPNFTVPNGDNEPLANGVKTTVSLPAGEISDVGIGEIANYLRRAARNAADYVDGGPMYAGLFNISYCLGELGNKWQTKQGNYAKRLSRMAYKSYHLKLTPEHMAAIGTIAREHSTPVDFEVEVTRQLNLPASQFVHSDSCWWQSYGQSRCMFKTNGGFGLRTFENDRPTGRAWVMPLKKTTQYGTETLTPTFETMNPDAYVVFNSYGTIQGYTAARILSAMTGMTYRKVSLGAGRMYINSDSGYIVAPEQLADLYTDGSLNLNDVPQHADLLARESRELVNV